MLLQQAGSQKVFEFHGNAAISICMMCHEQIPTLEAIGQLQGQDSKVPKCKICDGEMKMDVVLFGEEIADSIVEGAMAAAIIADVVLVVGTSLTVSPANIVVEFCRKRIGRVIVVDPDPNVRRHVDLLLCGKAGSVLPQLLQACVSTRNVVTT
ncbi:uncharacterized protein [Physcomitrium patens]|uniref:Deacetylase sirtuin-type domain-containing protein n=1 Tax=Physcomitrium patens TaxID=3218 RepID=A0A2K1JZ91_PHYPA|nr:uncharacterized protein LOC112287428 [Physcomitrium patens]XP_024386153.1 uncharacterized protein LOC112287428 [Physcomitrium patens]XP_024386154.1 uncharacterized protein LOC112287428 [Physcomitrium patens]PNR46844.1 hypothetical protein PHYPA_013964 [Physcomitrium patens]|eukprot:XP_024386151.1 uncharacterized protein LOC112287428 [Physcomitrella patens]